MLGPNLAGHRGTKITGFISYTLVKELHRQFFLLLRLREGCDLLDPFGDLPSPTKNVWPIEGAARCRHGLEVEYEGLLKDLVAVFVFLKVHRTVHCFLMSESYL
jgi:hypothetical protein